MAKAQAVQQLRGTRLGAVTVDGFIAVLRVEPGRVVSLLCQCFFQLAQFGIAIEHELQRGLLRVGDLLFDKGDSLAGLHGNLATVRFDLTAYQAEQRGFAAAIFADQPDALVGEGLKIHILEERNTALQVSQVLDIEHGAMITDGNYTVPQGDACNVFY